MTDLKLIIGSAIAPALALLPARMTTQRAVCMLLAIGGQESGFSTRVQRPRAPGGVPGPARSFWQFEEGGGVKGVLTHPSTTTPAALLCQARGVQAEKHAVWMAMATDDVLGAGMARLLLFADYKPLPELGDVDGAWDCYVRNWRPGEPHRDRWDANYAAALAEVAL